MRLVGFGVRVGRGGRAPVAEVLAQGGESPRRAPRLLDRGFDGSFDGVCGGVREESQEGTIRCRVAMGARGRRRRQRADGPRLVGRCGTGNPVTARSEVTRCYH